jgi:hypothetical protein
MDRAKWIGAGTAMGIVFGAMIHDVGLGMLLGVALGGLAAVIKARSPRH